MASLTVRVIKGNSHSKHRTTATVLSQDKIEDIKQDDFITLDNTASLMDKYEGYQHNMNLIVDIAQLFAEEYASLPGTVQEPDSLLKNSFSEPPHNNRRY